MGQWGFGQHFVKRLAARVAACAALAAFAGYGPGCGGEPSGPGNPFNGVVIPRPASLLLQVAGEDGAPIPIAMVTAQGILHTADSAGRLLLEDLPAGRFAARVEAPGFAPASVAVDLPAGAHGGAEVRLLPLGDPIPLDADKGGTIAKGDVRVVVPPGSLLTEDGEYATGMVDATVVPLDPTSKPLAFPGPLEGIAAAGGEVVGLDNVFMAEVSLWKDGRKVNLVPGAKATLSFPLPDGLASKYAAGDEIKAWWFDVEEGRFREDGAGTVQPSDADPAKLVVVLPEVQHFTWWAVNAPWTEKSCVRLLVVDPDGAPIGNVSLSAVGTNYTGYSSPNFTNEVGQACVDIKLSSAADIYIGGMTAPLLTLSVVGTDSASACGDPAAVCTSSTVLVTSPMCAPGSYKKCSYAGAAKTEGVGICKAARSYCNITGTAWLGCAGEVLPKTETCLTPYDDDCNGVIPPLSDSNACTADVCNPNGAITHTAVNTSDNNACTLDECHPVVGIYHTPMGPADISDDNVCTIDTCHPMLGETHSPLSIDDNKPCTIDACDPVSGVTHKNDDVACPNNLCKNVPVNDGDACTLDSCNPMTGIVSHTAINPDDGNACTVDSCDPLIGVTILPVNIDDANLCTTDSCDPSTGQTTHTVLPSINDNNACTIDTCDPSTGFISHTPDPGINDGNACTLDVCDVMTGQITHPLIPGFNDNNQCTTDVCDSQTGQISHTPKQTNDGNACTIDSCDPVTGAVNNTPNPAINDGNACTQDICDSGTGNVTHPPVAGIDDGNVCTTDSCNTMTGQITHAFVDPNDNNACSLDYCDPATGVHNDPTPWINDNNACTIDTCNTQTGQISNTLNPAIYDANACTQDICNTMTGAITHPPYPGISDGNPCTQDLCDTGTGNITHPPIPSIDDNNVCTLDFCNPVTGQVTHTSVSVDDGNACTIDSCHPQNGVSHTPVPPCSSQPNYATNCGMNLCNPSTGACEYHPQAFLEEFANNSQGWTFTAASNPSNQWAIGPAMSSAGHSTAGPDPANDAVPGGDNGVAGVAIGGNASTQAHGFYYMTSPVIDVSGYPDNNANNDYPLYLNFYRWLNSSVGLQNTVEVYDGTSWILVAVYNGLQKDTSWTWINLEISAFKNPLFQVRFGYSVGNGAPTVASWSIDHVRVGRRTDPTCP